jgi:hypothetical protein
MREDRKRGGISIDCIGNIGTPEISNAAENGHTVHLKWKAKRKAVRGGRTHRGGSMDKVEAFCVLEYLE